MYLLVRISRLTKKRTQYVYAMRPGSKILYYTYTNYNVLLDIIFDCSALHGHQCKVLLAECKMVITNVCAACHLPLVGFKEGMDPGFCFAEP